MVQIFCFFFSCRLHSAVVILGEGKDVFWNTGEGRGRGRVYDDFLAEGLDRTLQFVAIIAAETVLTQILVTKIHERSARIR